MANQVVALDQKNVFVSIRVLKDTDGTPKTDMNDATSGQEIWYWRAGASAIVTDGGSAADMSALNSSHTDWQFKAIREGFYRVAFPDAAFANGVGSVICGINATGFTGISVTVDIEPFFKFQGKAGSVTPTTTTFSSGPIPYKGDLIYVVDGTGITQTRLITSVSGQVATHLAWTTNISATTSTILLIGGDETLALGGINVDVLVSSRSTLTPEQANSEVDSALTDYDLKALLPATLTIGGRIRSAIEVVNNRLLKGKGQAGDEWGDDGPEV